MHDDVQRFNSWSKSYEESWLQWAIFMRAHRLVLDRASAFPVPEVILDVGCGTGRLLRSAAERWESAKLIGVDPAEGMIGIARRLTPGAAFHIAPAEALPLADSSVDLAFSTLSFHHWSEPANGLREVGRVLKSGGHFVLFDHGAPNWVARILRHSPCVPAAERLALFEAAGMDVVAQEPAVAEFVLITVGARRSQ
ncbi:MAG: class I SAM-dependent methyltransferase [Chloroflexi bacterium]|nr:class I SAM-dependent methyltransferase [Chloroflexota bacterium]